MLVDLATYREENFSGVMGELQNTPQEEILLRIGQYVRRWKRWVLSGVTVSGAFNWPVEGPKQYAFASPTLTNPPLSAGARLILARALEPG